MVSLRFHFWKLHKLIQSHDLNITICIFATPGYIRIKRTDEDDDLCGMDDQPLVGIDCELDDNGNIVVVKPNKVCGTSAVLFDVSYPLGVHYLDKSGEADGSQGGKSSSGSGSYD